MKIILRDIENKKTGEAFAQDLPPDVPLGEIFKRDKRLADFSKAIVKAKIDGRQIDNWREVTLRKDALVEFDIMPSQLAVVQLIIQILIMIISLVSFIVGLFQKPKKPEQAAPQSPNYTFEGIQDTYAPGEPIPVTYGRNRKGGQVLMYYLTMMPDKSGLAMSMMLSLGEGPVSGISDIELNDIDVSVLTSLTVQTLLGTSSQGLMEGFEQMKNTFHDGREITDAILNGPDGKHTDSFGAINGQQTYVVYRTVGNDVNQIEAFINAQDGLTCIGLSKGKHYDQWSKFLIEYRDSATGTNECSETVWNVLGYYRLDGKYERPYWDSFIVEFPYPSRWDVKFTWADAACNPVGANPGTVTWRLWLADVTEFRGATPTISNEALMTVRATPTRQLHGGRPTVTALVSGLLTDNYQNVNSYTHDFTQNPAWHVLDYMTNSRYGMGSYISRSEIDLQSFIDFATLADSMIGTCPSLTSSHNNVGDCTGTPDFHSGDAPQGDGGFGIISDPPECVGLWSKKYGTIQYGMCLDRMCCPPLDGCYGVFSGEATCEWNERWAAVSRIDTGSPVFGLVGWVASGSSVDTFTGYGWIYHHGSKTASICRWNKMPVNTYGTILASVTTSIVVGDFIDLIVQPDYSGWTSVGTNFDWCNSDNVNIQMFIASSANFLGSYTGPTKVSVTYVDCDPQRLQKGYPTNGCCGGIAEQGLGGIIALPNVMSGDYHGVHLEAYNHGCGLCYGGCAIAAGGCACDTSSSSNNHSSSGMVIRHWDNTCLSKFRFNESPDWHIVGAGINYWLPDAPF